MVMIENPNFTELRHPKQKWRLILFKITESAYFEYSIIICIISNIAIMSMHYEGSTTKY